jgi:prepilin-type N-terminal cleavage/methylation domain-containing protein
MPSLRHRRGVSLIEVLVVIAILVALMSVFVAGVSSMTTLQHHQSAKGLALTYGLLHDEAVLRNVTFRVAYHLDEGFYEIEVGDPDTLIFDDPEKRKKFEEDRENRMNRLTEREKQEEAIEEDSFQKLTDRFQTRKELPSGVKFGGVYTPQYGEVVKPSGDPEEPIVVHSYIFPNGFAEHTLVQLVEEGDREEGYTIEIEPLAGDVHLHGDVRGPEKTLADIPETAPELP